MARGHISASVFAVGDRLLVLGGTENGDVPSRLVSALAGSGVKALHAFSAASCSHRRTSARRLGRARLRCATRDATAVVRISVRDRRRIVRRGRVAVSVVIDARAEGGSRRITRTPVVLRAR